MRTVEEIEKEMKKLTEEKAEIEKVNQKKLEEEKKSRKEEVQKAYETYQILRNKYVDDYGSINVSFSNEPNKYEDFDFFNNFGILF